MAQAARYYGLYRAMILNDADPLGRGRRQVLVSSISGQASGWALPCVGAGGQAKLSVGDPVWVMFEGGDPSAPVCMGGIEV